MPTCDIEFGVARKVRSPNLYERYTWSTWSMAAVMNNFVGDGNGYVGNIDLKPEQAHTLSATFDLHATDRRWAIQGHALLHAVTDYIDAIRCTGGRLLSAPGQPDDDQRSSSCSSTPTSRRDCTASTSRASMPLPTGGWGDFGLEGVLNYTRRREPRHRRRPLQHHAAQCPAGADAPLGGWDNAVEVVAACRRRTISPTCATRSAPPATG
jgi:iron complex outermembrane receptor protein